MPNVLYGVLVAPDLPREVFTVARTPDQDDKGSQNQINQRSQSILSPTSPTTTLPHYTPYQQQPFQNTGLAQPLSYSESLPQDSQVVQGAFPQNPAVISVPSSFDQTFTSISGPTSRAPEAYQGYNNPAASTQKTLLTVLSPPAVDVQSPYYSNQNSGAVLSPPAPAYPGQQSQLQSYVQQHQSYAQPGQPMPSMQVQNVQPGAGPVMDMRNARDVPRDEKGEREWTSGLCEFSDCGTCCLGWFCPCILYSQVQTRFNHLENKGQVHPDGGDGCATDCLIHGTLTGCLGVGWVLQIGQRTSVRRRYGISGDGCGDCMMAYCCTPCELSQVSREIEFEEDAIRGSAMMPTAYPPNPAGTFTEKP